MNMAELPDQAAVKRGQNKEEEPQMQPANAALKAKQELDEIHDIPPTSH